MARRKGEKLSAYFLRRAERILPAYWLVVGIYSLVLRLYGQISLTVAAWNLSTLYYWFHIPNTFNWYVPAALAFYLIAPFYWKLFLRCRHKEVLTAVLLPLSFGLYRLAPSLGILHTQDFICRIPAFGLGILLGYYLLNKQDLTLKHAVIWGCSVLCAIVLAFVSWKKLMYIPACYTIGLLLVPGLLSFAKLLEILHWDWLLKTLRLLGKCSLEIYLLNVIVTVESDVLIPLFDFDSRHIAYYCIVYLLNIVLGIWLHKGIEKGKEKLSKWHLGRTSKN